MTKCAHGSKFDVKMDGPSRAASMGATSGWTKPIGLSIWLVLVVVFWGYSHLQGWTPLRTVQGFVDFLATNQWGFLVYVALYVVRPAFFFPATLLTMAAGHVYGPLRGMPAALLASNLSSMVAYLIGRYFGGEIVDRVTPGSFLREFTARLHGNSFQSVLAMRFLFLPYDLVSYSAGILRIPWHGFLLATVVGSIPGTLSFVLFGAAFEGEFTGALPGVQPGILAIGAVTFVVSIGLSRWFKRHEHRCCALG